jgi:hypothetical protein
MDCGCGPKILICVECGQEFVFTVNAQEYFAERGYTEDPKRCKHCYMIHKRDKRPNSTSMEAEKVNLDAIYPE